MRLFLAPSVVSPLGDTKLPGGGAFALFIAHCDDSEIRLLYSCSVGAQGCLHYPVARRGWLAVEPALGAAKKVLRDESTDSEPRIKRSFLGVFSSMRDCTVRGLNGASLGLLIRKLDRSTRVHVQPSGDLFGRVPPQP